MQTQTGDQIVDWLMKIASDDTLPLTVRWEARRTLTKCALRNRGQTVMYVLKKQ